jgi:hypothetical protein
MYSRMVADTMMSLTTIAAHYGAGCAIERAAGALEDVVLKLTRDGSRASRRPVFQ